MEFNFSEQELSKLIKTVACKDCKYKCFRFWNRVGKISINNKLYCQIAHRQEDILLALTIRMDAINKKYNTNN